MDCTDPEVRCKLGAIVPGGTPNSSGSQTVFLGKDAHDAQLLAEILGVHFPPSVFHSTFTESASRLPKGHVQEAYRDQRTIPGLSTSTAGIF